MIICYIKFAAKFLLFWSVLKLCRIFPIKGNKIVATAARGRKFADNPRFIVEELLRRNRNLDVIWVQHRKYDYAVPKGIKIVKRDLRNLICYSYHYSTAHIIIESAHVEAYFRKRKGQVFIQTWHGGLGIKKIENDANNYKVDKIYAAEIANTVDVADVFISNSLHLSNIYRSAFKYKGPIYNCGYPKNDVLFGDKTQSRLRVRKLLGVQADVHIAMYAPTFRDYFNKNGQTNVDMSVYDLDYERIAKLFSEKYKCNCIVLIKMHPNMQNDIDLSEVTNDHIFDVTLFNNIQELIMASDYFISDYSSCIFDAAFAGIPCYIYANDIEKYKSDERGVYYEMEELPFPYAENNDSMEYNIMSYDQDEYKAKWRNFALRTGLNETGHAAADISDKICEIIDGNSVDWNNSTI